MQLAEEAGLSHPFLSQIERGLARPSMSSLNRIAVALGTSPVELVAASAETPTASDAPLTTVVRADEGVRGPFGTGEARMLVAGPHRFQVLEFHGGATEAGEFYSHDEDEFFTVLEGVVRFEVDGSPATELSVGDSAYQRSGVRHRWSSATDGPFRLLVVKENPGAHHGRGIL